MLRRLKGPKGLGRGREGGHVQTGRPRTPRLGPWARLLHRLRRVQDPEHTGPSPAEKREESEHPHGTRAPSSQLLVRSWCFVTRG